MEDIFYILPGILFWNLITTSPGLLVKYEAHSSISIAVAEDPQTRTKNFDKESLASGDTI